MKEDSARLEYLDTLRGFAALSVVCSHFILGFQIPPDVEGILTYSPLHYFWDGSSAVCFFFVLSGFVLSLKYAGKTQFETSRSFAHYVIARVGRIWLPYAFVVTLSLILKKYLHNQTATFPEQSAWFKEHWSHPTLLKHYILELNLFVKPTLFTLIPQGWSLFIEMTLSLFIPAAAILAQRSFWQLAALVFIALTAFAGNEFIFHFFIGVALARMTQGKMAQWRRSKPFWQGALLLVGIALYGTRYNIAPQLPFQLSSQMINIWVGIGSALIILGAISSPPVQNFLLLRPLTQLGRISYSIYLCHVAILLCLTPWVMHFSNQWLNTHWAPPFAAGLIFTLGATVAFSIILYRWVERPSMALAKRICQRLGKKSPKTGVQAKKAA